MVSSYLENRKHRVCLGGIASAWLLIVTGVPLGYILGPILFLNFIINIVKYIRTNIRLFADDTILYKTVHNIDLAAAELKTSISKALSSGPRYGKLTLTHLKANHY